MVPPPTGGQPARPLPSKSSVLTLSLPGFILALRPILSDWRRQAGAWRSIGGGGPASGAGKWRASAA